MNYILLIFSSIFLICSSCEKPTGGDSQGVSSTESSGTPKEVETVNNTDPFSPNFKPGREDKSIVIKTKFVEIGSGTEELGFDWIDAPFEDQSDGSVTQPTK